MIPLVRLAWRHVAHHRGRALLLAVVAGLVALLPIAVQLVLSRIEAGLARRADATPLVVGAHGSRFDLVLAALYFRGTLARELAVRDCDRIAASGLARVVPLHLRHSARAHPLVGTTIDYARARGLALAAGSWPVMLGEVALGAGVARELDLVAGDRILSDAKNLYDLAAPLPLRMSVVGVLGATDGPDDWAVFCELGTAHLLDGDLHGHDDAAGAGSDQLLARGEGSVALDGSVIPYLEVRPEHAARFHAHGDRGAFALSAILAWPHDAKSGTLLKGRFARDPVLELVVPKDVSRELLELVVRAKRVLDANLLLVGVAMILLLALVVALSWRVRAAEVATWLRMGIEPWRVRGLVALELAIPLGAGFAAAAGLAVAAVAWATRSGWLE